MGNRNYAELENTARKIRIDLLRAIHEASSGHPGGSLSATDIITALYFDVMNIDPKDPHMKGRDRFVLSKGHAVPALYAALGERGYFNVADMMTLRQTGSAFQGHPNLNKVPGIDMSTGSLGQGFSAATGMATAGKIDGDKGRVYALLGDGELQEGIIWEAALSAAQRRLDNLTAIVDFNGLQIDGNITDVMNPEPVADKFVAFGWNVIVVKNGHDHSQIKDAIEKAKTVKGKPTMVVCKCIKGKGVSFMENNYSWHGTAPNQEQRDKAIAELNAYLAELEA